MKCNRSVHQVLLVNDSRKRKKEMLPMRLQSNLTTSNSGKLNYPLYRTIFEYYNALTSMHRIIYGYIEQKEPEHLLYRTSGSVKRSKKLAFRHKNFLFPHGRRLSRKHSGGQVVWLGECHTERVETTAGYHMLFPMIPRRRSHQPAVWGRRSLLLLTR